MILRPVSPASAAGPPTSKRPLGFTKIFVSRSTNSDGITRSMTISRTPASTSSLLTPGRWWVEMTTASPRRDVAGLLLQVDADQRVVGVEARLLPGVPDAPHRVADDPLDRHLGVRRDLADHAEEVLGHGGLAGDPRGRVLGQHGVQDGVR